MKRFVPASVVSFAAALLAGPSLAAENAAETGKAIYERANCVGCHKWHGNGGGGYGGAALSLRKTQFTKEQIAMTVRCGRPGTGMPYFGRDSYPTDPSKPIACYDLSRETLSKLSLAQGGVFLKADEVDAVADYVVHHLQGKGEPDFADCVAFFGEQSTVCEIYQAGHHHAMPTPATTR